MNKCITILRNYTKIKVIRITENQLQTLQKMKSLNVDVARFIRSAISEKLQREKQEIIKPKKQYCPF